MTEISFALIRSQNPEINTTENIEEIDCLRLMNCNIEEIDNLELFHHISELYLTSNAIESLDGLSILIKLKILDVANNRITSESLRKSIPKLPKTLLSINLTGNPCAEDEEALTQLQDAFPDAIIAIDLMPDIDEEEEKANDDSENKENEGENKKDSIQDDFKLDTESVLREIVARKCLMESTTNSFNLERTVFDLNSEMEKLIEESNIKRHERHSKWEYPQEFEDSVTKRAQQMKERNVKQENIYDYHQALDRIRDNALKKLQEIKVEHSLSLSSPRK